MHDASLFPRRHIEKNTHGSEAVVAMRLVWNAERYCWFLRESKRARAVERARVYIHGQTDRQDSHSHKHMYKFSFLIFFFPRGIDIATFKNVQGHNSICQAGILHSDHTLSGTHTHTHTSVNTILPFGKCRSATSPFPLSKNACTLWVWWYIFTWHRSSHHQDKSLFVYKHDLHGFEHEAFHTNYMCICDSYVVGVQNADG